MEVVGMGSIIFTPPKRGKLFDKLVKLKFHRVGIFEIMGPKHRFQSQAPFLALYPPNPYPTPLRLVPTLPSLGSGKWVVWEKSGNFVFQFQMSLTH
jgi:hypothetical protein